MTARLEKLRQAVDQRYRQPDPGADPWIAWGYENHTLVVARFAGEVAERFGGRTEFCIAAALVHDIADVLMDRSEEGHATRSYEIGKALLTASGFSDAEAREIIEDIVSTHSAKKSNPPRTLDGKILATADAMAHLSNDFFVYLCWIRRDENYQDYRKWALKKVEKAYQRKLFFPEIQHEFEPRYQFLKSLFAP